MHPSLAAALFACQICALPCSPAAASSDKQMGCCTSAAGTIDDAPPASMSESMEKEYGQLTTSSASGVSAREPSRCSTKLRYQVTALHARLSHGITDTLDITPDGRVYEAVEIPALKPKTRRRILEWLKRVRLARPPVVVGAYTSCYATSDTSTDHDTTSTFDTPESAASPTCGGAGMPTFDRFEFDHDWRPPRSGDLASTTSTASMGSL